MKKLFCLLLVLGAVSVQAQTGFIGTDTRLVEGKPIALQPVKNWKLYGWRGEKLSMQLLVTASRDLSKLVLVPTALKKGGQAQISPSQVRLGYVGYVKTDEFRAGCGYRKPEDFDSSLVTDPILDRRDGAMAKGGQQLVWVTVSIPRDAAPGEYSGEILVQAGRREVLRYTLQVASHELPAPSDWAFDLDLWQHPAAIARVHGVKLWSPEHYSAMRPYYEMLAAAGQKNITTSIVHEPWGHQTYDDFPSLVRWTKKRDGSWSFDYSRFDEYVEFVMSCGIRHRINCYSMIPWKMLVRYYDEAAGRDTSIQTEMGSAVYMETWIPMLKDFTAHLKSRGWFGKTSIAMDERPMKDMQTAIRLLKEIDPGWKLALAGDYHPEIEQDIFDYCVASRWQFDSTILAARKAAGKPSTLYTCCVEPYPNGFTFSPPAEHVWLGWYLRARGFTGYLRWAYNSWTRDPLGDSRFRAWPAGDTYQVYPGPVRSIRFEKLVEGIQDYEKIRILQEAWKREGRTDRLQALDSLLRRFEIPVLANTSSAEMVNTAKQALRALE